MDASNSIYHKTTESNSIDTHTHSKSFWTWSQTKMRRTTQHLQPNNLKKQKNPVKPVEKLNAYYTHELYEFPFDSWLLITINSSVLHFSFEIDLNYSQFCGVVQRWFWWWWCVLRSLKCSFPRLTWPIFYRVPNADIIDIYKMPGLIIVTGPVADAIQIKWLPDKKKAEREFQCVCQFLYFVHYSNPFSSMNLIFPNELHAIFIGDWCDRIHIEIKEFEEAKKKCVPPNACLIELRALVRLLQSA